MKDYLNDLNSRQEISSQLDKSTKKLLEELNSKIDPKAYSKYQNFLSKR